MKPPCSPLMGEGLGVRVRVPAVVTFPALVIITISFRSISSKNFWAIDRNFLGGWLPNSPIPQVQWRKIVICSFLFKFVIVLGYFKILERKKKQQCLKSKEPANAPRPRRAATSSRASERRHRPTWANRLRLVTWLGQVKNWWNFPRRN